MEGIELRARRVALGLSVAEAARLAALSEKHWREWEAGRSRVPQHAAEAMRELYNTVSERIVEALDAVEAAYDETGEPVPLFAYKTIEAFDKAGGESRYGLPWSAHTALVGLILVVCEVDELPAYIHGIHHNDMEVEA